MTNTVTCSNEIYNNDEDCENFVRLLLNSSYINGESAQCHIYQSIKCHNNKDCTIICKNSSCFSNTIEGGNATSMTIYCDELHSCFRTRIYCPVKNNSICNVFCKGVCSYSSIYAYKNTIINIKCY
eukprot:95742_1